MRKKKVLKKTGILLLLFVYLFGGYSLPPANVQAASIPGDQMLSDWLPSPGVSGTQSPFDPLNNAWNGKIGAQVPAVEDIPHHHRHLRK